MERAFYVWLNGHFVGYAEDSFTPSEFDLTPYLRERDNRLCVEVYQHSSASWLEDQDFFRFVGYAEDSFTPSEFDLTPYLRERDNRLCVEVYQHSSASWLEDQDFFRFSGIFRSVVLYAKPQTHVEDLWIRTGLQEDNTTGTFRLRLLVSGPVDSHRLAGG